jgi:hypothetical protein
MHRELSEISCAFPFLWVITYPQSSGNAHQLLARANACTKVTIACAFAAFAWGSVLLLCRKAPPIPRTSPTDHLISSSCPYSNSSVVTAIRTTFRCWWMFRWVSERGVSTRKEKTLRQMLSHRFLNADDSKGQYSVDPLENVGITWKVLVVTLLNQIARLICHGMHANAWWHQGHMSRRICTHTWWTHHNPSLILCNFAPLLTSWLPKWILVTQSFTFFHEIQK